MSDRVCFSTLLSDKKLQISLSGSERPTTSRSYANWHGKIRRVWSHCQTPGTYQSTMWLYRLLWPLPGATWNTCSYSTTTQRMLHRFRCGSHIVATTAEGLGWQMSWSHL